LIESANLRAFSSFQHFILINKKQIKTPSTALVAFANPKLRRSDGDGVFDMIGENKPGEIVASNLRKMS